MKIYEVQQGSPEWLKLRVGKPTSSEFERIITPKGNPTGYETSQKYINEILAEMIMGKPLESVMTGLMERGKNMEEEALRYYRVVTGAKDIKRVGFVTSDDNRIGASPDALVADEGLLEIKCPSAAVHVGYLMSDGGVGSAYKPQVQGQMLICERAWCDTISYFPGMPEALVRHHPDEKFMRTLTTELVGFWERLEKGIELITSRGWLAKEIEPAAQEEYLSFLGKTEADLDQWIEATR